MLKEFSLSSSRVSSVQMHSSSGKKCVAVLCGGMSIEREVSLASSIRVIGCLLRLGYKVISIDVGTDIAEVIQQVSPDVVFNCLHGTYGEDGCIPGLLNILRIPYTHSGVLASAVGFNKLMTNAIMRDAGILCTGDGALLYKRDVVSGKDPMPRPYVLKPIAEGSSAGVEVVLDGDDFDIAQYDFLGADAVLIEKYIKGRELCAAVLNGKCLGVLEIELLKTRFLNYDAKYLPGYVNHICPANIPVDIHQRISDMSEVAFKRLQCRGLIRVDFLYNAEKNAIYFLEVNTHPGMTGTSIAPDIIIGMGLDIDTIVDDLVKSARCDIETFIPENDSDTHFADSNLMFN